MRIAGIIAEYNPFHNGHKYHIDETRRQTGCDYVIAVMDGNFTQRGEAAALSKWTRAKMALACGADAVFELPALFAVRTADVFARSGVAILGGLGADVISFGSETEDVSLISALGRLRANEPEAVSAGVNARLESGMTHARAWGEAAAEYLGVAPEVLNKPNTILGAEYLRAIEELKFDMKPHIVRRLGEYHDDALGEIASASAIRRGLAAGDVRAALAVPECVRGCLEEAKHGHLLDDVLLMKLRSMNETQFAALADVSEGLDMRLMKACRAAAGREELIENVKTRRYTHARISRLLAHALLDITQELVRACPEPAYARLIGMREGAGPLMKELKRRAKLPVVPNPRQLIGDPVFETECRASDIWALGRDLPEERRAGRELTEKFIVL